MTILARPSLSALALLAAIVPAQSSSLSRFDGRWSILARTDQGSCSVYRYAIAVERGRARFADSAGVAVDVSVSPLGVLSGSIRRGSDSAQVRGRLGGGSGAGRWASSGSYDCQGEWTAERRPSGAIQE